MAKRQPAEPETVDVLLHRTSKSLEEIAEAAGITRRTLFAARYGQPVSRGTIVKLAAFLGVPVRRLQAAHKASRAAQG